MMKKLASLVVVSLFALVFNQAALAADAGMQIGVIDLQKIMQKSSQVAAINAQLEKEFKPRQQKLIGAQKNLQAEMDKLNKDAAVLSNADRIKLQDKVAADRADFQKMADSFQQDLTAAQNQAMQKFMQKVITAVNSVAASQKYDMILLKAAVPYLNPKYDTTDAVISQIK